MPGVMPNLATLGSLGGLGGMGGPVNLGPVPAGLVSAKAAGLEEEKEEKEEKDGKDGNQREDLPTSSEVKVSEKVGSLEQLIVVGNGLKAPEVYILDPWCVLF